MSDIGYSFILTSLAGLSTLAGYFAIFVKGDKNKIISFSLSFAAGVMTVVSIIDLIPSSYHYLNGFSLLFRLLYMGLFILLGVFLANFLDKHLSLDKHNALYRVGFLTMLGIMIHNIPEGIITFMVSQVDKKIGLSLAIAISLHNIPEGISISVPIYYATRRRLYTLGLVFLAGISELLGGLMAYILLADWITPNVLGSIFSLIAGIMLCIGLFELLRESYSYNHKKALIGFLSGGIVMIISHLVI